MSTITHSHTHKHTHTHTHTRAATDRVGNGACKITRCCFEGQGIFRVRGQGALFFRGDGDAEERGFGVGVEVYSRRGRGLRMVLVARMFTEGLPCWRCLCWGKEAVLKSEMALGIGFTSDSVQDKSDRRSGSDCTIPVERSSKIHLPASLAFIPTSDSQPTLCPPRQRPSNKDGETRPTLRCRSSHT